MLLQLLVTMFKYQSLVTIQSSKLKYQSGKYLLLKNEANYSPFCYTKVVSYFEVLSFSALNELLCRSGTTF